MTNPAPDGLVTHRVELGSCDAGEPPNAGAWRPGNKTDFMSQEKDDEETLVVYSATALLDFAFLVAVLLIWVWGVRG
jgi:hypothetical protein